tara:strand:- start:2341 stop:2625 length:285 start_codon:yes stop_codon:yes gene_type:complete
MISEWYCKEIIKKVLSRECVIQWTELGLKKYSTIKTFNPLNNTVTLKTVADIKNGLWNKETDEHISIDLSDKQSILMYDIKTLSIDEFKILLIK